MSHTHTKGKSKPIHSYEKSQGNWNLAKLSEDPRQSHSPDSLVYWPVFITHPLVSLSGQLPPSGGCHRKKHQTGLSASACKGGPRGQLRAAAWAAHTEQKPTQSRSPHGALEDSSGQQPGLPTQSRREGRWECRGMNIPHMRASSSSLAAQDH